MVSYAGNRLDKKVSSHAAWRVVEAMAPSMHIFMLFPSRRPKVCCTPAAGGKCSMPLAADRNECKTMLLVSTGHAETVSRPAATVDLELD